MLEFRSCRCNQCQAPKRIVDKLTANFQGKLSKWFISYLLISLATVCSLTRAGRELWGGADLWRAYHGEARCHASHLPSAVESIRGAHPICWDAPKEGLQWPCLGNSIYDPDTWKTQGLLPDRNLQNKGAELTSCPDGATKMTWLV